MSEKRDILITLVLVILLTAFGISVYNWGKSQIIIREYTFEFDLDPKADYYEIEHITPSLTIESFGIFSVPKNGKTVRFTVREDMIITQDYWNPAIRVTYYVIYSSDTVLPYKVETYRQEMVFID